MNKYFFDFFLHLLFYGFYLQIIFLFFIVLYNSIVNLYFNFINCIYYVFYFLHILYFKFIVKSDHFGMTAFTNCFYLFFASFSILSIASFAARCAACFLLLPIPLPRYFPSAVTDIQIVLS